MNNRSNLEKREYILKLIQENASVDKIPMKEDMKLFEDLEYDSIRLITLISQIEEEFQIEFEKYDHLVDAVDSVGDFIEYFLSIIK